MERQAILASALRLLARREHSRAELRAKLQLRVKRRGGGEADIELILDRLCAEGMLDDLRFIQSYIRLALAKGWGERKIVYHLQRKGVRAADIQNALARYDEMAWIKLAHQVLERKYSGVATEPAAKASQIRFLVGRGFSYDQIKEAMNTDSPGQEAQ